MTEDVGNERHEFEESRRPVDEVLSELVLESRESQLAVRVREVHDADSEELTSLDELRDGIE